MKNKNYWHRQYVKQLEEKIYSGELCIFVDKILILTFLVLLILLSFFTIRKVYYQIQLNKNVEKLSLDKKILKITFFDVGQGDATLISFDREQILIDTGPGKGMLIQESEPGKLITEIDAGKEIIVPYLKKNNVTLTGIIITHPHSDHFGGLFSIFEAGFYPKWFIDNGIATSYPLYEEVLKIIKKKNVKYSIAKPTEKIKLDDEIELLFLGPVNEYKSEVVDRAINNSSIVAKLVYKNFSVLFSGDIEIFAEMDLLEYKDHLKSTVLKVPHHGSFTSASIPFLDKVQPKIAIISCGRGNPFGHPHQETIEKLNKRKITIFRTDQNGNITILTDGINYKVITEREY
ncbi:MAG: ComEC/Rec2 family competence protein [Endomicrobiia bacterium]